jgi:hypothetical protein
MEYTGNMVKCNSCNWITDETCLIVTTPPSEPHFPEHHCPNCNSLEIEDIGHIEDMEETGETRYLPPHNETTTD